MQDSEWIQWTNAIYKLALPLASVDHAAALASGATATAEEQPFIGCLPMSYQSPPSRHRDPLRRLFHPAVWCCWVEQLADALKTLGKTLILQHLLILQETSACCCRCWFFHDKIFVNSLDFLELVDCAFSWICLVKISLLNSCVAKEKQRKKPPANLQLVQN